MIVISKHDIVIGCASGDAIGVQIPVSLAQVALARLRLYNGSVVEADAFSQFYIDPLGVKHVEQLDAEWQELSCAFDDELILDTGVWRVKTELDVQEEQAAASIEAQKAALNAQLADIAKVLLKLSVAIYQVGRTNEVWSKSDFESVSPGIVDTVQDLRKILNDLEDMR